MPNLKKNVDRIRVARGLTEAELSSRLNMAPSDLAAFLESPPARKETVIHKLSRELLVPEILLFSDEVQVRETRIPDFRLSQPAPGGYAKETLRWIDFAEAIQEAARGYGRVDRSRKLSSVVDASSAIPPAAARLREVFGFTDDVQLKFKDARLMF